MLEATISIIIPLVCMGVIGLVLNIWLLYNIKTRTHTSNAVDVLQMLKIVVVILALLLAIPFEFLPCGTQTSLLSAKICVAVQDFTDDCFFHTIPWTLVTVALIRKKICECRGRANILITRRQGLKTLMVCLIPSFIFMAISGSLLFQTTIQDNDKILDGNTTEKLPIGSRLADISIRNSIPFTVSHTLFLNFIPTIFLCLPYIKLYHIVRQTAQAANELLQTRNFDPSRTIIPSIVIHIILSCGVWTVFVCVRIASVVLELNNEYLVFTKLIILIVHPFGDGLLQPSQKKATDFIHERIHARFRRQVYPSDSFSDLKTSPAVNINTRNGKDIPWTRTRRFTEEINASIQVDSGSGQIQCDSVPQPKFSKGRKESREELRKALKVLGGNQNGYSQIRRLSTTLRLSTGEYPAHDLYDNYEKSTSPNLSMQERAWGSNNVCEGSTAMSSSVDYSAGPNDTPRKRWRRLFTTARTVRRFSRERKPRLTPLESCLEATEGLQTSEEESPKGQTEIRSTGTPIIALEPGKQKTRVLNMARPGGKRRGRSYSCHNNQWLEREMVRSNNVERKLSQDESVFVVMNNSVHPSADTLRSISYDANIYLKFVGNRSSKRSCNRSVSRRLGNSGDAATVENSKEECIKTLLDMRDCF